MQSQTELDEAIRLYEVDANRDHHPRVLTGNYLLQVHKEAELTVHVFPGLPPAPGQLCHGEDRSNTRSNEGHRMTS